MARWFDSVVVLAVSAAFAFLSHHDGSWLGKQHTDSSLISRPQATEMTFGATWDVSGLKRVPRKSWKIGETNITKIATLRVPVVFENSPATEWAEQGLDDILSLHDVMNGTRVQNGWPVFVLRASDGRWKPGPGYDDRVFGPQPRFETAKLTTQNVSVAEFLESDPSHQRYMYFTTPLESWQPPLKEKIVTSLEVQTDETIVPKLEDGETPLPWPQQVWGMFGMNQSDVFASLYGTNADSSIDPHATLWLSQTNVTAHWHYDCSHNWFIQLHGTKRVLLAPPASHHHLRLFPSIHPSYHQSQLDPREYGLAFANVTAYNSTGRTDSALSALIPEVYSVVVRPGDVLYIPPYWFHTVTALNMSLSLSVISPSEEEMIYSKAFWLKVPFGKLTSKRDKVIGTQFYLSQLLLKFPHITTKEFVEGLLVSRYASFYPVLASSSDAKQRFKARSLPMDFDCYKSLPEDLKRRNEIESSMKDSVQTVANQFAEVFRASKLASGKPVAHAVQAILLEDYVEELSLFAVGPWNVAAFLAHCLL